MREKNWVIIQRVTSRISRTVTMATAPIITTKTRTSRKVVATIQ